MEHTDETNEFSPQRESELAFYADRWTNLPIRLGPHQIRRFSEILWGISLIMHELGSRSWRICDLGCGTGWLANQLKIFGDVTGVDYSPKGIEVAKQRWNGVHFEVGDVTKYRSEKKYDLIVCTEVIEHVENQDAVIETIDEILEEGGFLILTCPNNRAKKYAKFEPQPIENWPSHKELKSLIESRGFSIVYNKTFFLDFSNKGIMRLINSAKLRAVFRKIGLASLHEAFWTWQHMGLYQIFVAAKRPG